MSKAKKPLLIMGCSDAKLDYAAPAFSLYQGGLFKMLRSNLANPLEHFDILILSAEHGLIHANSVIEPYNTRMCSRKKVDEIAAFAEKHGKDAIKKIRGFADEERNVFVALTNDYLAAFNEILGERKEPILGKFGSFYISEGHTGIGDLRGRLSRIIKNTASEDEFNPVLFRSGVANFAELGYLAAGCDLGTSLAHVNTEKSTDLLSALLDGAKQSKLFFDNGIITCVNQGKDVDSDWIFNQYEAIISSLKPSVARNISIVVPDDVMCNESAIAIVKKYKKQIKALARRCDVILPIHKSSDIRAHALRMMSELNYNSNIRLGVPCLTKKGLNFALDVADIDALLSLKNPKKDNEPLFNKVHYFGLSDATAAKKLQPRLMVAELHGVDTTLDCCRTAALFGKTKTGLRKGSQKVEEIKANHVENYVKKSPDYISHNLYKEDHQPDAEPVVTKKLYELINEEGIFAFIDIYNEVMTNEPALKMPEFELGEEEEAIEMAWNLVGQRAVTVAIFERLKDMNWAADFDHIVDKCTPITPQEARFNAIRELFKSEPKATPIQMPLRLTA